MEAAFASIYIISFEPHDNCFSSNLFAYEQYVNINQHSPAATAIDNTIAFKNKMVKILFKMQSDCIFFPQ